MNTYGTTLYMEFPGFPARVERPTCSPANGSSSLTGPATFPTASCCSTIFFTIHLQRSTLNPVAGKPGVTWRAATRLFTATTGRSNCPRLSLTWLTTQ